MTNVYIFAKIKHKVKKLITPVFQSQNNISGEKKNKYKDPLNQGFFVALSNSNEIGTAISDIAPRLGAALWIPTFMYLGADIYDKYKNDKDNYDPSGKRAFKRAVYQALTSVVAMPAAIILGKYIISPIGKLDKTKVSGNTKDAIYRHTRDIISQAHGHAFKNYDNFKKVILTTLENTINSRKNDKKTSNIFSRLYKKIFTERYQLLSNDEKKILKFAEQNAKNTFEIFEALKKNDAKNVPKKILNKYNKMLPKMKEMYHEADYSYQATRNALMDYQTSLIFKNKLLKTISGITVLFLLTKPINDFVDKQIMKKVINPGIDQIAKVSVNDSRLKKIFNDMVNKSSIQNGKNGNTLTLPEKL